jgi:hypothetical protein
VTLRPRKVNVPRKNANVSCEWDEFKTAATLSSSAALKPGALKSSRLVVLASPATLDSSPPPMSTGARMRYASARSLVLPAGCASPRCEWLVRYK